MKSFQILSFFHFYFRISPFVNLCILAFVQAPSYMRWIFLFLVPVNLTMDLNEMFFMDAKTGEVRVNKPIEVISSQVAIVIFVP